MLQAGLRSASPRLTKEQTLKETQTWWLAVAQKMFHVDAVLLSLGLQGLLFNPAKPFSRGAGSQSADMDLMIDCFVSCFRINPHNNQQFKVCGQVKFIYIALFTIQIVYL